MNLFDPETLHWRRGRCANTTCVEVARIDDDYLIRDSNYKNVTLAFTAEEWAAFRDGVKGGEFDDL